MANKNILKTKIFIIFLVIVGAAFADTASDNNNKIKNTNTTEQKSQSNVNMKSAALNNPEDVNTKLSTKILPIVPTVTSKASENKTNQTTDVNLATKNNTEEYLKLVEKNDKEVIAAVKNNIAKKIKRSQSQVQVETSSVREKSFADNEQVNVVLSNRDVNRVLVKGDKIQSVNGPAGLYTAKNDMAGSAYISVYGDSVFTIFIATAGGHNVSLLVSPRETAGRTVILQPTSLSPHFEAAEGYQTTLITLISTMINNEDSSEYSYVPVKSKKADFYKIADIKPIASYSGEHLIGITSEIKNKSKNPITLKPAYFYKPEVRAVSLSQQTLAPSETGLLYQIISRAEHE